MTKLKLGPITEEKPVKATLELPASLHRGTAALPMWRSATVSLSAQRSPDQSLPVAWTYWVTPFGSG